MGPLWVLINDKESKKAKQCHMRGALLIYHVCVFVGVYVFVRVCEFESNCHVLTPLEGTKGRKLFFEKRRAFCFCFFGFSPLGRCIPSQSIKAWPGVLFAHT
jgi:hypothetical protein